MTQETVSRKILVAVAWPYVNGVPHVGHFAGAMLPADIIARFHRLRGNDVLMVSGSDCFGTPITVEADRSNQTPKEVAEFYHPQWQARFERLKMSYDLYTSTLTENHQNVVQDFFLTLLKKGYIGRGKSQQYYSPAEKRFLPDRYVEGTCPHCGSTEARSDQCEKCGGMIGEGELLLPISKVTGAPAELRETEHYFLEYQKFQPFLEKYVEKHSPTWRKWIKSETQKWLNQGLRSRAISRDIDWGIPIPTSKMDPSDIINHVESKRLYVWFDAVIGYLSASIEWSNSIAKNDSAWETYWKNPAATHYYFMGKDNLVFHTLFWPAYLHGFDETLHLPDVPAINQYLTLEGEKFSKSRGVLADPSELADTYGLDALRFYLCTIMPETSDSDFSVAGIKDAVNGKLIAKIGNFINRTLTLASGLDFSSFTPSESIQSELKTTSNECAQHLEGAHIRRYIERLLQFAEFNNGYITQEAPWSLKKEGGEKFDIIKFKQVMGDCLYLTFGLLTFAAPVLVESVTTFNEMTGSAPLQWSVENDISIIEAVRSWSFYGKPTPLFSRIE
jgi:methionyl-tRNA synthetase